MSSLTSRSSGPARVRVRTSHRPAPAAQRRSVMRTEYGSWDVVAAKWVLGRLPSQALPAIATDALVSGLDSQALRELAGELHPTVEESGPLFEEILGEFGIGIPDRSRAGLVLAKAYAAQIIDGTISPYEGAQHIWRLQVEVEGLMLDLGPFVYWASEWQETNNPASRRECDAAIRAAALELVGGHGDRAA